MYYGKSRQSVSIVVFFTKLAGNLCIIQTYTLAYDCIGSTSSWIICVGVSNKIYWKGLSTICKVENYKCWVKMSGTIVVLYLPHITWSPTPPLATDFWASARVNIVPQSLLKALALAPLPQGLAPISNEKIRKYST